MTMRRTVQPTFCRGQCQRAVERQARRITLYPESGNVRGVVRPYVAVLEGLHALVARQARLLVHLHADWQTGRLVDEATVWIRVADATDSGVLARVAIWHVVTAQVVGLEAGCRPLLE